MLARLRVLICLLVSVVSASLFAQTAPTITGISPFVGVVEPIGGSVTIQGSGFGATQNGSTVTFAGIQAAPTSWSEGAIVTPVPGSVPVGVAPVVVTVNGVASNSQTFIVIPVITTASPLSGPVGTPVTISGVSFGPTQSDSTVSFNGANGTPTSWADGSITVPVPLGASDGPITVTVNGFATNGYWFYIVPAIRSLQPAAGVVGTQVTITGSGFGASQGFGGVTFNGISATVLPQNWTDTSIVTTVPVGATTGPVVVTSADLVTGTGANFNVGSVLVSLFVSPVNPPMPLNGSQQFTATGGLTDGTLSDYTSTAAWNSSNTSVVTVNNGGLAQAVAIGSANVTATVAGISGTTTITVQPAPTIRTLSATSGVPGATITVTGSGFGSAQGTLTFNGAAASTTWSDGSITATVPEGATTGNVVVLTAGGLSSNAVPFTVTINPVLSGQFSQTVTAVTLTSPVGFDWEHWGMSDDFPLVTSIGFLSGFTPIGTNTPSSFSDGEIEYSWTDGDLLPAADRTTTGVLVTGMGNGFHLSIPANGAPQTLLLYLGAWEAQGQLTASLSDNSAPNYTDSSVDIVPTNGDHHANGTYTITFRTVQPGQTLNIDYVLAVDHGAANGLAGYVSLQSAVLMQSQPTVALTSPQSDQTFPCPSAISLAANASQIDVGIAQVSFFSDGTNVFNATTSPYTFNLTGLAPGDHTLTATATDGNGLTTTSSPILVTEVGTGGVLNAAVNSAGSNTVDLSSGTSDWSHWTNVSPDRKAGITPQVSDLKTLANGSTHSFDASGQNGVSYSWESGTPTNSQNGTATQVRMQAYQNGFQITVPADTTLRTLNLYLASGFGQSTLRASLSDGSAAPYVNVYSTPNAFVENVYTIQYQAGSSGQTLTITDQVTRDDGFAYVALESASVSDQNPPLIDSVTPATGAPGAQITIAGTGFGASQGNAIASLNGTPLNIVSWSDAVITATVPLTQSGAVVVSRGLANSNGVAFTVTLPPAPVISFLSPTAGVSGTLVQIFGSNFGASQNNSTVTFNGVIASPTAWIDSAITVPAPPGVHSGPVVVTTVSGSSNGAQFTFSPGIRFSLQSVYVSPDESTLEVGGAAVFTLVNPSGAPVTDATWTVDNSTLASIGPDSSTPAKGDLQALAPGEITVTGTSSLGSAQAKATIYAVGLTPAGTPVWSFYPQVQDNAFEVIVKSLRNNPTDPYMYVQENTDNSPLLSALDDSGHLLWRATLNPINLNDNNAFGAIVAPATDDGGVLAQTNEFDPNGPDEATGLYRFDASGNLLWTYSVPTTVTSAPALGSDGTIWMWTEEDPTFGGYLDAVNDANGQEKFKFNSFASGSINFVSSETPDPNNPNWKPCVQYFPNGVQLPNPGAFGEISFQPIVGSDGNAYMMQVAVNQSFNYSECDVVQVGKDSNGNPVYIIDFMSGQVQYSAALSLVSITPDGSSLTVPLSNVSFNSNQAVWSTGAGAETSQWTFDKGASQMPRVIFDRMVPDGQGGILMTWAKQSSTPGDPGQNFLSNIVGGSAGPPISISPGSPNSPLNGAGDMATNAQGTMFLNSFGQGVTAFDIATGSPKWSAPGSLFAATADGGAIIQDSQPPQPGNLRAYDQNGISGTHALPVTGRALYMSAGSVSESGSAGDVGLVQTSFSDLQGSLAVPWSILALADPQQTNKGRPDCLPFSETTKHVDTDLLDPTIVDFDQTVGPEPKSTVSFQNMRVTESSDGQGSNGCFWKDSGLQQFPEVSGGFWDIGGKTVQEGPAQSTELPNHWGFDLVGLTETAVTKIIEQGPAHHIKFPCTAKVLQKLSISCHGKPMIYETGNILTSTVSLNPVKVTNCRTSTLSQSTDCFDVTPEQ